MKCIICGTNPAEYPTKGKKKYCTVCNTFNKTTTINPELEETKYEYGRVTKHPRAVLKALFTNDPDEMIILYLKSLPNRNGALMAHLILYFVYYSQIMGERRLRSRLKGLSKRNLIYTNKKLGFTFYKAKKD
jgi:hypothetical protein